MVEARIAVGGPHPDDGTAPGDRTHRGGGGDAAAHHRAVAGREEPGHARLPGGVDDEPGAAEVGATAPDRHLGDADGQQLGADVEAALLEVGRQRVAVDAEALHEVVESLLRQVADVDVDRLVAGEHLLDHGVHEHGAPRLLPERVVAEHEPLAVLVEEVRTLAGVGVRALGGEAERRQRGLDELHVHQRRTAAVGHRVTVAGVVGEVPAVEREPGDVAGDPVDVAGGHDDRGGAHQVALAGAAVEADRSHDPLPGRVGDEVGHHRARQEPRAVPDGVAAELVLEAAAVEVEVVLPRQPEGAGAEVAAGRGVREVDADVDESLEDPRQLVHGPLGDVEVGEPVGELRHEGHEVLGGVPLLGAVEGRHELVDAAGHAPGPLEQLGLVGHEHRDTGVERLDGGQAARHATADHEHVGLEPGHLVRGPGQRLVRHGGSPLCQTFGMTIGS